MKIPRFWKTVGITVALLLSAALASPGQTLKVLASTSNPLGYAFADLSFAPLLQATDGYFYGTAYSNGTNSSGTVFQMTPAGAVTVLYNFCSQPKCTDGAFPQGGLVQGRDGDFYGTTSGGSETFGCPPAAMAGLYSRLAGPVN